MNEPHQHEWKEKLAHHYVMGYVTTFACDCGAVEIVPPSPRSYLVVLDGGYSGMGVIEADNEDDAFRIAMEWGKDKWHREFKLEELDHGKPSGPYINIG